MALLPASAPKPEATKSETGRNFGDRLSLSLLTADVDFSPSLYLRITERSIGEILIPGSHLRESDSIGLW